MSNSFSTSLAVKVSRAGTDPLPLSVVVIARNEASRLAGCLESVKWAGEIVVVDDESSDETIPIAHRYTDRVLQRKMEVEGRHRNWAYAQARHEWVLSLDADERVTPELAQEIQSLLKDHPPLDVYAIPRRNFIGGRWIRYGGWYPSAQVKLFRRSVFKWEEATVHPRALTTSEKPWGHLKNDLIHYSYRDLSDFVAKLNRQTTLEAEKWIQDGRRMNLFKALWRTLDRFLRSLLIKKGYRDGFLGFIVAVHAGLYQFLSFAKYWHLRRTRLAARAQGAPAGAQGIASGTQRMAAGMQGRLVGIQQMAAGTLPTEVRASKVDRPAVSSGHSLKEGVIQRKKLSVVILSRDAMPTLPDCLASVSFADEIIVVDGGSTDGSVEAALAAGAKVIVETASDDFGMLRNLGAQQAAGDWILQLDADEVVTPEFRQALGKILSDEVPHAAYRFRRRNRFLGHWMRFGGWEHDSLHLFLRGKANYQGRVHERLLVEGSIGRLKQGVEHYPFRSLEEFIDRQNRYTSLEALELKEQRREIPETQLRHQRYLRPAKLFWKIYVRKLGFREGMVGLIFSLLFSYVHFLKWAKHWELTEGGM